MRRPRLGSSIRAMLLASTAILAGAGEGLAQAPTPSGPSKAQPDPGDNAARDVVVIVGSNIVGAKPTDALPVTVVGQADIDAIAQVSGDELFRSIPQLGDVGFNTSRTIGSLNDARGDTASINLRALGTGNTLVLLNGRRMVNHPGVQSENSVPVVSVNANAIPVAGIERVEVLLDGASAIYGADAVAGVVNTVLKKDFEGLTAELNYGGEEGIRAKEFSGSIEFGINSPDKKTNVSILGSFYSRDPIYASERDFTARSDLRYRLPAQWAADPTASAAFNNTSLTSAWGIFDRFSAGNVSVNGTVISNAAGQFHVQPSSLPGCLAQLQGNICFASTSTRPQDIRYDVNSVTTTQNGVDRYNLFAFLNHKFDNGVELFAEMGGYLADSLGYREEAPMLGAVPIVIPASNYYNPFGPVGSANRLAITNAPAQGLDLVLGSLTGTSAYRPIDAGPRKTEVENVSTRFLAGLRGEWSGWDWESALLYTQANTEDRENRISNTLFQQALARSTPDAYNPFNGGCVDDFDGGDCTPSQRAAIDSFTVTALRRDNTSLASWDFKLSRPDLFHIWAGEIGAAVGVEARHEDYTDDRDPRQDGSITFRDIINTSLVTNDLQGNSASLDTHGQRDVQSAYAEFQVPLVSRDMNIPLVQTIDAQIAARFENFDTFGSVTKPKVALSWRPLDFLLFRSSWSQGFRAPNLQQEYENGLQRSNIRTDFIRCEAAKRKDPTVVFTTACPSVVGSTQSVISNRQGSTSLQPEDSDNLSAGFVLESTFLPEEWGRITFTADWWRIKQTNVVGVFGDDNHILLDYVLRLAGSTTGDPAVHRAAPDAQDTADFQGTGIAPVGDILFVDDNYLNLDRREARGIDFGLYYDLKDTPAGDWNFRINAAYLDKFFQEVSEDGQVINAAVAAGKIPSALSVSGQGNLVRNFGRPKWRYTSSLTWRKGPFGAGWFTTYVGDVEDPNIVLTATGQRWVIDSFQTHNVYLQYELGDRDHKPLRIRVGVRNIFNEVPPLADTNFGYLGDIDNPAGRFMYVNLRKEF